MHLRQFQAHYEPPDLDRMLRHSKRKGQSAAEYLRRALRVQLDRDDAVTPLPEEGGEVRVVPRAKELERSGGVPTPAAPGAAAPPVSDSAVAAAAASTDSP